MVDRISGDGLQKTDASYSNRRKKRDSGVWKSAYILSSAWDMREQGLVALDLHETRVWRIAGPTHPRISGEQRGSIQAAI